MKLKEWAEKTGIKYLTAYRWFKNGDIPGAYQTSSGTILVQDEVPDEKISNDAMSIFLKKTVEFSKNNASVEDFAAYIISNFQLKLNNMTDSPKYSRNKPKSEEVQKHFQQFIKPKGEKPKTNMFIAEPETLDELVAESDILTSQELATEIQNFANVYTG